MPSARCATWATVYSPPERRTQATFTTQSGWIVTVDILDAQRKVDNTDAFWLRFDIWDPVAGAAAALGTEGAEGAMGDARRWLDGVADRLGPAHGLRLAERLGGLLAALGQGQCRIRVFLFGGLEAGRELIEIMLG